MGPRVANESSTVPDVVLPEQVYPLIPTLGDPERRLRLAVLEDAVRYVQLIHAPDGHTRVLHEDALDWVTDSDRSEPFSFENVCEALGLDPGYIRDGLLRWLDAQRACGATRRPTQRLVIRRVSRRRRLRLNPFGASARPE